jgi:long-subunit fatty acid transport protein
MRRQTTRAAIASAASIIAFLATSEVSASTGFEFPENGTELLGRAGAWVARASNPLATFFNPAGIVTQPSGVILNTNLIWQKNCFRRTDSNGNPARFTNGGSYEYGSEVCNTDSATPYPNPQIAGVYRVAPKLALGLAVLGPSTRGKFDYPLLTRGRSIALNRETDLPSPGRYLLGADDLLLVWPQVAISYQVTPELSVGASFIWGVARFKFTAISAGGLVKGNVYDNQPVDAFEDDFRADLDVHDWFVPGFTLGALYQATSNIDVGAWYMWSDDVKATGDSVVTGPVYSDPDTVAGPGEQARTDVTGNKAKMTAPWPMQARVGVRFHVPRDRANTPSSVRDPIADDIFDIELDATWANNSHFKDLTVTFPAGISINVPGLNGAASLPQDASIPHHWKDAFGFRLGGDYVVLPNQLAVRAGGFFQTEAQDPKYLHLDYVPSQMVGVDAGLTVRISGKLDLMAAYGHVFYKGLDNHGQGEIKALCGIADCGTPSTPASSPFRSPQSVNGGSNSSVVNIASIGVGYSF